MIVVNYSFSFNDSTKNFIALFRAKNTAFHFLCSIHTIKKKILNIIMSCDKFHFNLLVKFVIQKYDKELTLSRCRWQKILLIFSFAPIARSRNVEMNWEMQLFVPWHINSWYDSHAVSNLFKSAFVCQKYAFM